MKRIVALLLVFVLTAAFFTACGKDDSPLTADEAVECVLDALDAKASELSNVHVHPGDHDGSTVYNVSFSYKGESFTYSVDAFNGEILHIAEGAHSH